MAGFIQRSYPASGVDAARIQGDSVSTKDPAHGQAPIWDDYTKQYIPSTAGGGGSWGSITGTLADQTDLQNALDAKAPSSGISPSAITGTAVVTADARLSDERVPTSAGLSAKIHAATSKATPVDSDDIGGTDSATSNSLARFTWANIKATLKSYFDTIYTLANLSGSPATAVIAVSTNTTLSATHNCAVIVCTSTPQLTINTGLGAFSASIKGAFTVAGTATVTDVRTTGATNPWCTLLPTGTDTYDLVGGKA